MGIIVGPVNDFFDSLNPLVSDPDVKDYVLMAQKYTMQYQDGEITSAELINLLEDINLLKRIDDLNKETSAYIFAYKTVVFIEALRSLL